MRENIDFLLQTEMKAGSYSDACPCIHSIDQSEERGRGRGGAGSGSGSGSGRGWRGFGSSYTVGLGGHMARAAGLSWAELGRAGLSWAELGGAHHS